MTTHAQTSVNDADFWDDVADNNTAGRFAKFDEVGDYFDGTLLDLMKVPHPFDESKPKVPVLTIKCLTTGIEKELTVSQYDLRQKLAKVRPQVGDRIRIEYVEAKPLPGDRSMKIFSVKKKSPTPKDASPASDRPTPQSSFSSKPLSDEGSGEEKAPYEPTQGWPDL